MGGFQKPLDQESYKMLPWENCSKVFWSIEDEKFKLYVSLRIMLQYVELKMYAYVNSKEADMHLNGNQHSNVFS